jgi:hypothetical protein
MSEQHVLDHFNQIDFWEKLLFTEPSHTDWCDRLAINVIILRIRGKDADHINKQVLTWIERLEFVEVSTWEDTSVTPDEDPPSIEAVIERANELTALMQKAEVEAT